ncbi:hypothetical protein [Hymenobacter chitinivorans]|uniref:Uncharacterized protein n=1 Tax=Hymenobacter chitinivorans DSM 11115 TaxID=1121954 RepID=A0A2M9BRU6_9BACT|nr:hypothetical protein [Hymenobacter chitinivorans]PJJ60679.1 hypothetical protein CLV45_2110 [Hymenobacter chitinivorans DSM 11115]
MIQNLPPGTGKNIGAGEIEGAVYLYRTEQGGAGPGWVSWQPQGAAPQVREIVVGQTVAFLLNGGAGLLTNGCPSVVRVLHQNQLMAEDADALAQPNRGGKPRGGGSSLVLSLLGI